MRPFKSKLYLTDTTLLTLESKILQCVVPKIAGESKGVAMVVNKRRDELSARSRVVGRGTVPLAPERDETRHWKLGSKRAR